MGQQLTKGSVFDYSQIKGENARGKLRYFASTISKRTVKEISIILDDGVDLIAAQEVLANHKNGIFQGWIAAECHISKSMAYSRMSAARAFGGAIISSTGWTISASVMYLLSADSCPAKATEQALKLLEIGKPVPLKLAKELIEKNTIPAESEPTKDDEPEPPQVAEEALELLDKPTDEQLTALSEYEPDSQIELAESVAKGIQSLDQAIETGDVPEETAEQVKDRVNKEIESFCRALKKLFESCPDDPWMEHADYKKNALSDLDLCCKQLRLAKCKHVCPDCDGAGCKYCLETGRMPDHRYKQMAIQS